MSELLFIVDPVSKQLRRRSGEVRGHRVKERQDLEVWVTSHPLVLGEELLVITSEFDRFDRSDRRLDVLALDKNGYLVVVELKLVLEGSFADQQAIRYAAFCSTMTMDQVVSALAAFQKCSEDEATQKILEFLEAEELPELGSQQRIILAAGSLDDEELTSTVLWLRSFGVDITCVEMKPYRLPDTGTLVLVPRVIIPLPEAKDFLVRVEQKQVAQIKKAREATAIGRLWEAIAARFDGTALGVTARPRPGLKNWMPIPTGYGGVHYEWLPHLHKRILRVALHLESTDRAINEQRLKPILARKEEIASGVEHPFFAEPWGERWATAEFHLPYDKSMSVESIAPEAARVMRILIQRTWPIIEPVLKKTETLQPPADD